jgi:sulfatase maturation enzyme AslB (radical SAM superfamily)
LNLSMAAPSLSAIPAPATDTPVEMPLRDSHGRVIHDLRVSITDRCNYKCIYCRTGELGAQYPELAIDEYLRLIALFVGLGITKVRLTGGEPLLRRGLIDLIRELSRLRTLQGQPLDLALTTNGHLLESLAQPLKDAGLHRITVSMDAVDAATFERITRIEGSFDKVLAPRAPPGSRLSRSTACSCAALTTTRSKASPASPAKKMSSSALLSSCLSKKAASGRLKSS